MPRKRVDEATFSKASAVTIPSLDGYLKPITVYGNSTQAGTPTPDAPVPIVSTTGNAHIRSVGNNMAIHNAVTTTVSGVTFTVNPDNSITIVGTSTAYIQFNLILNSLALPANTNFVLSGISGGAGGTYFMELKYLKNSGNSYVTATTTPLQFSTTESVTTGSLYIVVNNNKTINTTIYPQIEVGTGYTPYTSNTSVATLPLGTTQLRSLPNGVSDRIYKDGSTWKLEQNVQELVFNGTENWSRAVNLNGNSRFLFNYATLYPTAPKALNNAILASTTQQRSNMFMFYGASFNYGYVNTFEIDHAGYDAFVTMASTVDLPTFKALLVSNNLIINYPRATSLTTPVTDPTLITALENIRTYQGVTNITASTPVSGVYLPNSLRTAATNRLTAVGRQIATNRVQVTS